MRHVTEVRGYCRACLEDAKTGSDLHICRYPEPADDRKHPHHCAWCGHVVTP